ncbi:aminotransferase class III-fold pyridoxal phosphate-dependent enzyme [Escherichia coli]|nr:aminotransferase class III-fold pyridoxal phosphate-dependent enzyme [Escherichia coli]
MDAPAAGRAWWYLRREPAGVLLRTRCSTLSTKNSLCERANQLGQRLTNTLIDAKESVPSIAAVRGLGSMIAAEFNDPQTGEPSAAIAQKNPATRAGAGAASVDLWRIRQRDSFLYPLTIPDAQFDAAMKILQDALND